MWWEEDSPIWIQSYAVFPNANLAKGDSPIVYHPFVLVGTGVDGSRAPLPGGGSQDSAGVGAEGLVGAIALINPGEPIRGNLRAELGGRVTTRKDVKDQGTAALRGEVRTDFDPWQLRGILDFTRGYDPLPIYQLVIPHDQGSALVDAHREMERLEITGMVLGGRIHMLDDIGSVTAAQASSTWWNGTGTGTVHLRQNLDVGMQLSGGTEEFDDGSLVSPSRWWEVQGTLWLGLGTRSGIGISAGPQVVTHERDYANDPAYDDQQLIIPAISLYGRWRWDQDAEINFWAGNQLARSFTANAWNVYSLLTELTCPISHRTIVLGRMQLERATASGAAAGTELDDRRWIEAMVGLDRHLGSLWVVRPRIGGLYGRISGYGPFSSASLTVQVAAVF